MKQLARKYCFWKGISTDIERIVKSCPSCAEVRKSPPKVVTHHWEEPIENFQRVHIDYAGPFQNYYFFVLVDAKSKWPEIRIIRDAPTSEKPIDLLQDICATHGLPQTIVSDNATIFQSAMFRKFCCENGIIQKFIAPGHPATNGLAERYVQILKKKLKANDDENVPLNIKLREILFRYRATPLANGQSPARMYLGRDLRIKLDAMRPVKQLKSAVPNSRVRHLSVGDRVQVRWFQRNKPGWKFGVVKRKFGHLHYQVKLDDGYELKRHINQLYKSGIDPPKKTVTLAEPPVQRRSKRDEIHIEHTVTTPATRPASISQPTPLSTPDDPVRRSSRIRRPPTHLQDHVRY
ncbi:PREDICTED: uncharacterized protein K02A2.6-like [Rhagoletis zephyria]|uniref:uncharacterized protein K02A2.6-like n=1 Tax=Rhagoletis zephyria TaxID=28612 RepID=UPI00081161CF|nr:PREDICTED: uncharacterized protein K02A2.6-like [Rhagoletis zephyria]